MNETVAKLRAALADAENRAAAHEARFRLARERGDHQAIDDACKAVQGAQAEAAEINAALHDARVRARIEAQKRKDPVANP